MMSDSSDAMVRSQLRNHVWMPVPNPREAPKETLSKPEMLSAILSNLDKSHQIVRNNIITAAKAKQQEQQAQAEGNKSASHFSPSDKTSGIALFLANLNAPAPLQDPCMPPTGAIPPPPPSIIQQEPPRVIGLAQETCEQLEQYDRCARQTRHYYQEALGRIENPDLRRRRSSGTSSLPSRSPAHGVATAGFAVRPAAGYGNVNASPAEWMHGRSGSANASPWGTGSANVSPRDPRARQPPPPPR